MSPTPEEWWTEEQEERAATALWESIPPVWNLHPLEAVTMARTVLEAAASVPPPARAPRCSCYRCAQLPGPEHLSFRGMIVCPFCGNKRCPHASDHHLACTKSNEPGQPGSVYGVHPSSQEPTK